MIKFLTGQGGLWPTVLAFLIVLSALAATPAAVRAQQAGGSDPEAVARAWVDAVNRGDTEAAIALYADDAVIQFLGKEVVGKEAIARRQRTTIAPMLKPSLEILDVVVDGDTARLRLRGENAVTRWDHHDPVINDLSFSVRNGKIYREVGPVLSAADAAWYVDAQQRFSTARTQPATLPKAGGPLAAGGLMGLFGVGVIGLVLLTAGIAARRRAGCRHRSGR